MPYDEYLKSKSKLKVYTYFWDTLYNTIGVKQKMQTLNPYLGSFVK